MGTVNKDHTQLEYSDYEYECEESEDETDNSFLMDPEYFNNKARMKSKFLPLFLSGEELLMMKTCMHRKGHKTNNFPFWILIFDYLSLEDIGKVNQVCQSFHQISQDDRILEKFIDSDFDEDSESEEDKDDSLVLEK